jgi:hypothetical protein
MTKLNSFPLLSLLAIQAAGQIMLVHAGLTPLEACGGMCAVLATIPFGSRTIRRFYRRALAPMPRFIKA